MMLLTRVLTPNSSYLDVHTHTNTYTSLTDDTQGQRQQLKSFQFIFFMGIMRLNRFYYRHR